MRCNDLLVEAIQGKAPLEIVDVCTVDAAIHSHHPDVLQPYLLAGAGPGATLLGGAGPQLKRGQSQHSIIGDLVGLHITAASRCSHGYLADWTWS